MSTYLVVGIIIVGIFLFTFIFLVLKGTSEKGMEKTLTKMGNVAARAQANVIKNNEEIMKETANRTANINKDAIKTMSHAVKEGFSGEESIYCKRCGNEIDIDSKFCKHCGKEQ